MAAALDLLSWITLSLGGVFYVIGAVGLNRMPDVFSRMHAVSVGETLGVGLMVLGMLIQAGVTLVAVKLIFIVLALWTSGAVATHALARAALHDGEMPLLADAEGRLAPTNPVRLFPELERRLSPPLVSETPEELPEAAPEEIPLGPRRRVRDAAAANPGPKMRRKG